MTSVGAIRRPPARLLQISRRQVGIEIVQQRPVVEDRPPAAPLGVSRHFPSTDGEVGPAGHRQPGNGQRRDHRLEHDAEARRDVRQRRVRNKRQCDGVIQATSAEDDGSAAGEAPDDRHAVHTARVEVDVVTDHAMASDDDDRGADVPASSEAFEGTGFNRLKQRLIFSEVPPGVPGGGARRPAIPRAANSARRRISIDFATATGWISSTAPVWPAHGPRCGAFRQILRSSPACLPASKRVAPVMADTPRSRARRMAPPTPHFWRSVRTRISAVPSPRPPGSYVHSTACAPRTAATPTIRACRRASPPPPPRRCS